MLVTWYSTARSVTEIAGDGAVGEALGHQPEHLALARGELGERIVERRPTMCATTSGSSTEPPSATR